MLSSVDRADRGSIAGGDPSTPPLRGSAQDDGAAARLRGSARDDGEEERGVVGVVGLGLIGGSFARAYHAAGWRVLAFDPDADVMDAARVDVVDGCLGASSAGACDLIVLATYPAACLDWLRDHADGIGPRPVVIDTAGVKAAVCAEAFPLARAHGFRFCGAHPMAGTQYSGYARSRADLFRGAPLVLVPPELPDAERLELLDRVRELVRPAGFGSFSVTTAAEHDRVIAYTSQLCHVVSNAYVKSPTAQVHHGFSAGSYRDLTRVAHLNPGMWAELMMDDAGNLGAELDRIIASLAAYRDALAAGDAARLRALLAEGDRIKRALDDADNS